MISFVTKLADPRLGGRVPGTTGLEVAKQLILSEFERLRAGGLRPLIERLGLARCARCSHPGGKPR
jgi:hypothetical protein